MQFDSELEEAFAGNILVRIARAEFEATCPEFEGYLLGRSDSLVGLALLDDRVRFNGIDVFYIDQITELEVPAPHAVFYESALRLRADRAPEPPPLDLSSMRGVLESVSNIAPLVVIHREALEPEVCEIGRLTAFDAETFRLREIDPDADWADEDSEFRYEDVTRVGFAGEYEAALALVAGIVV